MKEIKLTTEDGAVWTVYIYGGAKSVSIKYEPRPHSNESRMNFTLLPNDAKALARSIMDTAKLAEKN